MRYHNITKDDMLNGDGLRVVLWVAGCNHCCKGCQNPVTWDAEGGILFDEKAKEEIYKELEKAYISGITFSGGDPLYSTNTYEVTELAKDIKSRFTDKTVWLYTGYEWEAVASYPIMNYVDVVVDGKFELDKLDPQLHWKGSSNQKVIDVKETKKQGKIVLYCED